MRDFSASEFPNQPNGAEKSCWCCYLVSYHNLQHCKERTLHVTGKAEQYQPRLPEGTASDHSIPGTLEGDHKSSIRALSAFKAANPVIIIGK